MKGSSPSSYILFSQISGGDLPQLGTRWICPCTTHTRTHSTTKHPQSSNSIPRYKSNTKSGWRLLCFCHGLLSPIHRLHRQLPGCFHTSVILTRIYMISLQKWPSSNCCFCKRVVSKAYNKVERAVPKLIVDCICFALEKSKKCMDHVAPIPSGDCSSLSCHFCNCSCLLTVPLISQASPCAMPLHCNPNPTNVHLDQSLDDLRELQAQCMAPTQAKMLLLVPMSRVHEEWCQAPFHLSQLVKALAIIFHTPPSA